MNAVGAMTMPADFRYREVCLKGKPRHERFDSFLIRHPRMDAGRRAKIFSPFDALKGFNEAVAAKDVLYESRAELTPEELDELNRRFEILRDLSCSSRMAGSCLPQVTVTCYVPCSDENSEAYGLRGRYQTIAGTCRKVDAEVTKTIQIDGMRIRMEHIRKIEVSGCSETLLRKSAGRNCRDQLNTS